MVDYVKTAAMAQRLVKLNGRSVSLIRLNTASPDAAKPWRGNDVPAADPAVKLDVSAVFVNPSSSKQFLGNKITVDTLFASCEQVCIVATTTELKDFNEIIDTDGTTWKIKAIEKLAPGTLTVLYFIGVAR